VFSVCLTPPSSSGFFFDAAWVYLYWVSESHSSRGAPVDSMHQTGILAQLQQLQRGRVSGGGGGAHHVDRDDLPLRSCPQGHTLAGFSASTHNCDVCGEHAFPGVRLYGCRACNYDTCARCYAGLPGQAAPEPLAPLTAGVSEDLAALHLQEGASIEPCRAGTHRFVRGQCMVCKGCGCCTGYGRGCLLHQDGRARGEECGCGGGLLGCAKCGLCQACCGHEQLPGPERRAHSGDDGGGGGGGTERSKFVVHVGERSFTVESTASSLAAFKSERNMRSLRRDFAAKLGLDGADSVPPIRVDDAASQINSRGVKTGRRRQAAVAQRIIGNHAVEWKRVAQLAVLEVAKATGPRFCGGGVEAEKAVVCEGLLTVLEAAGWNIRAGIDRIWQGARTIDAVALDDEDENDQAILRHILSQIVGSVAELRAADPSQCERLERATARALTEEARTWRCAARLATLPASREVTSERSLVRGPLRRFVWPCFGWNFAYATSVLTTKY
jgi:hypothetical protein